MTASAPDQLAAKVRESGLVPPGSRGVALLSGGPDSACLAVGLAEVAGVGSVAALHLNYGLRADSGADEAACRELCEGLGLALRVSSPDLGPGNVQAAAREARYAAAEALRAELGFDWIAVGHTRTDLAETVVYRLATSPGRRALLGLRARHGRVIRPLLALGRAETRELALACEAPFHDDPSNEDPRFARARIRGEVLPVLRDLNPAAEGAIAATQAELAEDAEALEDLARQALEAAGAGEGGVVGLAGLEPLPPALARLGLRALAERVSGRPVSLSSGQAAEVMRLARASEGGAVDLGGGLRAICESGLIRMALPSGEGERSAPEPTTLAIPGSARFGAWELRAERVLGATVPPGPESALLDGASIPSTVEVRPWHSGDRLRPLGMSGHKTLQDLFTDRRVPRSLRRTLPVVCVGEQVVWVAGVAVSEDFRVRAAAGEAVLLTATRASG